jgi:acetolactate synthase-1/2/3 large subunit
MTALPPEITTGQHYLAHALHAAGVTHVFMVPSAFSGANAALDRLGVRVVVTHGEIAAAYMADAYARATHRPGVCFAQNIGASNLAAGLRDAAMAGIPVIALTGGTSPNTSHRRLYQQVDDLSAFDGVTKWNAVVEDVQRLPELLRQAFRIATSGAPGPVHLRVPGTTGESLNAQLKNTDTLGPLFERRFTAFPAFRPRPEPDALRQAMDLMRAATQPVIVAGGGVRASSAEAELLAFARQMAMPIVTSMNGKGSIDERDPLAAGVVGSYSRDSANMALEAADLVVFVGSGTGSQVTDKWRLPANGTRVIQIDIDPNELGRHFPNAVSILGDVRVVLSELNQIAAPMQRPVWLERVQGFVAGWRQSTAAALSSTARPIRPERICAAVEAALPDDGILLSDTGHAGIWTASMIDLKPSQSFLRCAGSLGWAMPAAIGASAAALDRTVVAFTGDGGFYYYLSELETAVRHGFSPIIVVNNNTSLSQNWRGYSTAFGGEISETGNRLWQFHNSDLTAAARALGCHAVRIEDPEAIEGEIQGAIGRRGPTVLEVIADPAVLAPPPYGGRDFYDTSDNKK